MIKDGRKLLKQLNWIKGAEVQLFICLASVSMNATADRLISDALETIERVDSATTSCNVSLLDKLTFSGFKGHILMINNETGKYDGTGVTKQDVLKHAADCGGSGYTSTTDRKISKAEVMENNRVDISGAFTQTAVSKSQKKVIFFSGRFLTTIRCTQGDCQLQIEVNKVDEVSEKSISD